MATRYYITSTSPSFTPGDKGTWNISNPSTVSFSRTRGTSSFSSFSTKNASTPQAIKTNTIVSEKLAAQTISGTMNFCLVANELNGALDSVYKIHVWVSAGDTSTVRGTLVSNSVQTTEFPSATYEGRGPDAPLTLSSVACSDGDRIIVEIGYLASGTSSSDWATILLGGFSGSTSDLTPGDTNTNNHTWVEFSADLAAFVSTKLYAVNATPAVTVSSQGTWNVSHASPAATLERKRTASSATSRFVSKNAAANQSLLCARLVSPELSTQTLNGRLNFVLRAQESAASNDMTYRVHAWVYNGSTGAVRGTLVSDYNDTAELLTTAQGQNMATPPTMSTLGIQDGDRLVVEIGVWSPTLINSQSGTITIGAGSTTGDLTVGSTSTTLQPYIEITQVLVFYGKKEVTATGIVKVADSTREVEATAMVTGAGSFRPVDGTAIVQETKTKAVDTAGSMVQLQDILREVSGTATITAPDSRKDLTADAQLDAPDSTREVTATGRVEIFTQRDQDFTATAIVLVQDNPLPLEATSILQGERADTEVTGTGFVVLTREKEVAADAQMAATNSKEVSADGEVVSAVTLVKQVTATATMINVTETNVSLLADGYISPGTEVAADAIVTIGLGTTRLVKWDSAAWSDLSGWRQTSAEKIDGASFVATSYALDYGFVAGFSAAVTALAICVDLSSATGTPSNTLIVSLKDDSGTVLVSVELPESAWSSYSTSYAKAGWFLLELPTPYGITSGTAYRVGVTAMTTGPNILTTNNGTGATGVVGRVLNTIVVTDETATVFDGRPLIVGSRVLSGTLTPRSVVADSSMTADALYITTGSTVTLAPADSVVLTVNKLLEVHSGGSFISAPTGSAQHVVKLGATGGVQIHGALSLTGSSKTRYARLATGISATDSTIPLDRSVSGWVAGDKLYISSSGVSDGAYATVSSTAGSVLTLAGGAGLTTSAGAYVINLTRSSALRGASADLRAGFGIQPEATLTLTHAEISRIGLATTIAPSSGSTVTINDLVLSELRQRSAPTGGTALAWASSSMTVTDLAIVMAQIGIVSTGSHSFSGETILAGLSGTDSGLLVKSGTTTASVVATNLPGAVVNIVGGTRFTGSITNDNAHTSGALVSVSAGVAEAVTLTGSRVTSVAGESCALLYLASGGGLAALSGSDLDSDAPWLRSAAGALFLGSGRLVESTTSHASAVVLGSNTFVHLVDEDGVTPATISLGSRKLLPGGRISNKYYTLTDSGAHGAEFAIVDSGSSSFFIKALSSGTGYTAELGRIGVLSGETVTISLRVRGSLSLSLESAVAPDVTQSYSTGTTWTSTTIATTATEDGVIILSATSTSTTAAYVDGIERL